MIAVSLSPGMKGCSEVEMCLCESVVLNLKMLTWKIEVQVWYSTFVAMICVTAFHQEGLVKKHIMLDIVSIPFLTSLRSLQGGIGCFQEFEGVPLI